MASRVAFSAQDIIGHQVTDVPRASGTLNIARTAAPMVAMPMQQDAPGVPTWAWVAGGVSVVGAGALVAWKFFGRKGGR